jgi:Na+/H+ antiporter NhaD/arsenite permease-like protein
MSSEPGKHLDLTRSWVGFVSLAVFFLAYTAVVFENKIHLRKSKPVVLAAGIVWTLVAIAYARAGDESSVAAAIRSDLSGYVELFLFVLAAMTFVNTMEEREVFDALRAWLVRRKLSLRAIFWTTGIISFFLSSVLDNLTTALVMGTVAISAGKGNLKFTSLSCISIVVAANAGGAFCPFGDITTLMVWQSGRVEFWQFFALFVPSLVNWLIPAFFMSFAVPKEHAAPNGHSEMRVKRGGFVVVALFALTIVMAVMMYNVLHIPPVMGMMTGLGLLYFYGYYLKRQGHASISTAPLQVTEQEPDAQTGAFDIFDILRRAEWDTLMFFYGIIMTIGGLAHIGYLASLSKALYTDLGPVPANVIIGLISAVVDNIPVMFAVLEMAPAMSLSHWLLVTLTAGVGGSLLSVGSAAGVALMGQSRGIYTFESHLRWTWAIALGYAASIGVHLWMN